MTTRELIGAVSKWKMSVVLLLAACSPGMPARERALDAAASATYAYVVQRDLMGLYDTEWALDNYHVPRDVRARLGTRRSLSRERA